MVAPIEPQPELVTGQAVVGHRIGSVRDENGNPAAVVMQIALCDPMEEDGPVIVMAKPETVDKVIEALIRHRNIVWPNAKPFVEVPQIKASK